ncbi:DUF4347 domain-containing protein [Vreelandella utahensis]|uniref:DUF4347 domain-containing protein n=1 Tax=Vreelandella halophila TaxID=86177 RepID=UPI0009872866|nr:DUF4347 domain-containing protein [Halomonas utahensis]
MAACTSFTRQILFLDLGVPDWQQLMAWAAPSVDVVLLDPQRDGLEQIARTLEGRQTLDAIHIVAHGHPGQLYLGNAVVDAQALADQSAQLSRMGAALGEEGSCLLYACNVAEGNEGKAYLAAWAAATGASVAASSTPVGASALGGNWQLDHQIGTVDGPACWESEPRDYAHLLVMGEDFDDEPVGPSGSVSVSYGDFTFYNNPNTNIGIIGDNDDAKITSAGDNAVYFDYDLAGGITSLGFRATDGSEFALNGFEIDGGLGDTAVIIEGKRNGTTHYTANIDLESSVSDGGASYSYTGDYYGDIAFDGWDYLDEVTFSIDGPMEFGGLDIGLDDINVGAPVPPNSAPTLASPGDDAAYTEEAGAVLVDDAFTVTDDDGDTITGGTVEITGNRVDGDVLAVQDQSGITSSYANGVLTLSGTATTAEYEAVLRTLTFDSTSDVPTGDTRTLTYSLTDSGSGSAGTATQDVTVTPVNDAPTLSPDTRHLDTIDEDATGNGGTTVATILGSAGTTGDAEGNTLGVAVTGVTDTDGTWEYSTDGGGTWNSVASASPADNSALLLAETDHLRFVPDSDFNGTPGGGMTLRAWDQTAGSAGDTGVDTTTNGGTSAFSTDAADVTVTVDAVNDAPGLTLDGSQTVGSAAGAQTVADFVSARDPGAANESDQTVTIDSVNNDDTGLFDVQPVIDDASGDLTFTPAANANGTATVTVSFSDDGGTANGGSDSNSQTFDITVNDTDAPTVDVDASNPTNGDTNVPAANDLTVEFSENIAFGTSGTITLFSETDGSAREIFDVGTDVGTGDGQVSITGSTLTINPSSDLPGPEDFSIDIDAGAIEDTSGNSLAAFDGTGTLQFTSIDPNALITLNSGFDTTDGTGIQGGNTTDGGDQTLIIDDSSHLDSTAVISGGGGSDTIIVNGGGTFDFAALTSDVQGGFDSLETAGSGPFTVIVDATSGLDDFITYTGQSGKTETLEVSGGSVDLTQESFSDWDMITATDLNATLTINAGVLNNATDFTASGGGTETLTGNLGATADLTGRDLSGFEVIENTATGDTTFKLDGSTSFGDVTEFRTADLAGTDTLTTADTTLDISGITLTNIDTLATSNGAGTTFTLSGGQLTGLSAISGGAGDDTLASAAGTADLTGLSLSDIETYQSTSGGDNTIKVDPAVLTTVSDFDVTGGTGDVLQITGGAVSLDTGTRTVAGIDEIELASDAAHDITLDDNMAAASGNDLAVTASTALDNGVTVDASGLTGSNRVTIDDDNLQGADILQGGAGGDTLDGAAGDDTLDGGGGADTLSGGNGTDRFIIENGDFQPGETIDGGAGNGDRIAIGGSSAVTADFSAGTVSDVEALRFTSDQAHDIRLAEISDSDGNAVNALAVNADTALSNGIMLDASALTNDDGNADAIDVDATNLNGDDSITGGNGGDTINGGVGNDTLTGGGGEDTLSGGEGDDTFLDSAAGLDGDTILDFTSADEIVITGEGGAVDGAFTQFDNATNTLTLDTNDDGTFDSNDTVINLSGVSDSGFRVSSTGGNAVVTLNAVPTLSNLDGDSASVEAGEAATLDAGTDASVTDVDNSHFDGGRLTLARVGSTPEGSLQLDGVALAASDTVTVNGTDIGTVATGNDGQGSNDLAIDLNSNATAALVGDLLQNLRYTSQNADTHTFDITLADGEGGTSAASQVTINVDAIVDPPPTPTPEPEPEPEGEQIDGVTVTPGQEQTEDGDTIDTITIQPVPENRDDTNPTSDEADIPLHFQDDTGNQPVTILSLPTGVGASARTNDTARSRTTEPELLSLIRSTAETESDDLEDQLDGGGRFLEQPGNSNLWVNRITLQQESGSSPDTPIRITGQPTAENSDYREAMVIDGRSLDDGQLELNNIEFAVVVGNGLNVSGGAGNNTVFAGAGSQTLVLGEGDDELHGGAGDDVVGSKGGDDRLFGNNGNDTLFGGAGNDLLHGGRDQDVITVEGNRDDYIVTQDHSVITLQRKDGDDVETIINAETLAFEDETVELTYSEGLDWITTLYDRLLDRQGDLDGVQYWADQLERTDNFVDIVDGFLNSDEFSRDMEQPIHQLDSGAQVDLLYQTLLQREAETEGRNYWINDLENGMSLEGVAASIALSAEASVNHLSEGDWAFLI